MERRQSRRHPLTGDPDAGLASGSRRTGGSLEAIAREMSRTGVGLTVAERFEVGEKIELALEVRAQAGLWRSRAGWFTMSRGMGTTESRLRSRRRTGRAELSRRRCRDRDDLLRRAGRRRRRGPSTGVPATEGSGARYSIESPERGAARRGPDAGPPRPRRRGAARARPGASRGEVRPRARARPAGARAGGDRPLRTATRSRSRAVPELADGSARGDRHGARSRRGRRQAPPRCVDAPGARRGGGGYPRCSRCSTRGEASSTEGSSGPARRRRFSGRASAWALRRTLQSAAARTRAPGRGRGGRSDSAISSRPPSRCRPPGEEFLAVGRGDGSRRRSRAQGRSRSRAPLSPAP